MCGVAGLFASEFRADEAESYVKKMTEALLHRGPDSSGFWQKDDPVVLGHRRLKIIDLTDHGAQPMTSLSGRYVISYNGEVYNFLELKKKLQGREYTLRSESDTEVLVNYIEAFGIEQTLTDVVGMFAFALWDRKEKDLFLVRDRMGEKPLYYTEFKGNFLFASELKSFFALPGWRPEISRKSLSQFMSFSYVPAPATIFEGVHKVEPAHYVRISMPEAGKFRIHKKKYWDLSAVALGKKVERSQKNLLDELESQLTRTVSNQMLSDVPLGAFLSGGVDSTLIVALMQKLSSKPIKTFTIGYGEHTYNESEFAQAVADHLGTEHTEMKVRAGDIIDLIPKVPEIYDEPFADSSQLPTTLISRLTREHVTVSLSGDGGDEVFGGYNRYLWAKRVAQFNEHISAPPRKLLSTLIKTGSVESYDRLYEILRRFVPKLPQFTLPGDKIHKLIELVEEDSELDIYLKLLTLWDPEVVHGGSSELSVTGKNLASDLSFQERMMFLDTLNYLPNDILTKVDRASMAASLESRAPFLDHRIIEFAWTIPLEQKIQRGKLKSPLKSLLARHLPKKLFDRPKAGFGIPIDTWLRDELRGWGEDLLSEERLRSAGYFDAGMVREKWEEHQSGRRRWQYHLWNVLVFEAWREKWGY